MKNAICALWISRRPASQEKISEVQLTPKVKTRKTKAFLVTAVSLTIANRRSW
jgi:hypothetical protein